MSEINPGPSVYSVTEVKLYFNPEGSNPNTIEIVAKGTVRSGGWQNPQLNPFVYAQPPEDGMKGFSFTADSPSGPVPDVMDPIRAVYVMEDIPDWFKGVRVHAETNSMEVALE